MSFTNEGNFNCQIVQAITAMPKYCKDPGAFDVCLEVKNEQGETDWINLEFSQQYGRGNFSDRMQWQITMERLATIGLPNNDFNQLETLVGKTIGCFSKKNDKGYINVYLGGGNTPEAINPQDAMQRAAAIMQGGGFAQSAQTAQPTGPAANPFQAF